MYAYPSIGMVFSSEKYLSGITDNCLVTVLGKTGPNDKEFT